MVSAARVLQQKTVGQNADDVTLPLKIQKKSSNRTESTRHSIYRAARLPTSSSSNRKVPYKHVTRYIGWHVLFLPYTCRLIYRVTCDSINRVVCNLCTYSRFPHSTSCILRGVFPTQRRRTSFRLAQRHKYTK